MTVHVFALASDWPRLTPAQRATVTHIIADDGEWSGRQIDSYIGQWLHRHCETQDTRREIYT